MEILWAEARTVTELGHAVGQFPLLQNRRSQPLALADQLVGELHFFDVLGRFCQLLLIRFIERRLFFLQVHGGLAEGFRLLTIGRVLAQAGGLFAQLLGQGSLLFELLAEPLEIVAIGLFKIVKLRLCGSLVHVLCKLLGLFGEFLELLLELVILRSSSAESCCPLASFFSSAAGSFNISSRWLFKFSSRRRKASNSFASSSIWYF